MASPNRTLAELTTTTQTTAWIPRDVYAKGVLLALYSERRLGNLAAARRFDVNAGEGNTVKVRTLGRRTAQGPIAEGASLVANNGSFSTVAVSIQKFGDRDDLTDESIFQTSDDVKGQTLAGMGAALNEKLESEAMAVLTGATGTATQNLTTAGLMDYQDILKAQATLKANRYRPDFLIISPAHEADLLMDSNLTKMADYSQSEAEMALVGEIGRIGNIRVLVHELAPVKDATAGALNGLLIDSSRAFVEAFGKPLRFAEQYVPESDQYKEVAWIWYGAAVLDPSAICKIKNA